MSELPDRIEIFLRHAFDNVENLEFDQDYQQSFANDGDRKAQYIIERLSKLEREGQVHLPSMAYISIGGADGSELHSILSKTTIGMGILIEVSDAAIAAAKEKFEFLELEDRPLLIVQNDAVSAIAETFRKIKDLGFSQICISAQAILHELPDRSFAHKSDNRFLGSLFGHFERTLFVSREPCDPDNWPTEVEVSLPGVDAARLAEFVKYIGKELRMDFTDVATIANRSVIGPRRLIVEALHKLLRSRSPVELRYELGEQLTSFDANKVRDLLADYCGSQRDVELEYTSTEGFRDTYRRFGVHACDTAKKALPLPNTHARLIAFQSLAESQGTTHSSKKKEPTHGPPEAPEIVKRLRAISQDTLLRTGQIQSVSAGDPSTGTIVLNDDLYVERDIENVILDRLKRRDFLTQPLAVLGEPGVGKSSLLWSITRAIISDEVSQCDAWLLDAQDLLDFFGDNDNQSQKRFLELKTALSFFANAVPPVILIDTADAVLNRQETNLNFKDLLSRLRDLPVQTVITSRPGEAHELSFLEPNKYDLGNYSDTEFPKAVRAYAEAFVKDTESTNASTHASNLQEAASSGYPIDALARNPLALQMIYAVYAPHEINYAEIDVVSLYRDYWERRISSDFRPGARKANSKSDLSGSAELLGLAMLAEGTPELHKETAKRILQKHALDPNSMDTLVDRGVFIEFRAESGSKITFFHQTFFEHSAARAFVVLTGAEGLRQLARRYMESGQNYFLGCVLERAIVLADYETADVSQAAQEIAISLCEATGEAATCAIYVFAHKPRISKKLQERIVELIRTKDPTSIERFLDLAPNMTPSRQLDALPVLEMLLSDEDFRRAEQVIKALVRFSFTHCQEVANLIEAASPQDGILKDITGSALVRKAYYLLLARIAPMAPTLVWKEMIRLYADGLSRTAGESDGLSCVAIALGNYDVWSFENVAETFERDVQTAIGQRRVYPSNDLSRGIAKIYLRDWERESVTTEAILNMLPEQTGTKRAYFTLLYALSGQVIDQSSECIWDFLQSTVDYPDREIRHYLTIITWSDLFAQIMTSNHDEQRISDIAARIAALGEERQTQYHVALIKMVSFSDLDIKIVQKMGLDSARDSFKTWTDTRGLGRRLLDAAAAEIVGARKTLDTLIAAPRDFPDRLNAIAIQARNREKSEVSFRILAKVSLAMRDPFALFPSLETLREEESEWLERSGDLFQIALDVDPQGDVSISRYKARFLCEYERLKIATTLSISDLMRVALSQSDDIARSHVLRALNYRIRFSGSEISVSVESLEKMNEAGFQKSRAQLIQCIATLFEIYPEVAEERFLDLLDLVFSEPANSTHIAPIARPIYVLLAQKSNAVFGICERLLVELCGVSNATANGEYTRLARVFIIASQRAQRSWSRQLLLQLKSVPSEVGRLLVGMLVSADEDLFEEIFEDLGKSDGVPDVTLKRVADLRRNRHRMHGVAAWTSLLDQVSKDKLI